MFFTNLRDIFLKPLSLTDLLASSSQKFADGFIASYISSKLISNSGKPHTIVEVLIFLAVKEVLKTVLHHSAASSVIKNAPLNDDTVRRQTDKMSEDVESYLFKLLMSTEFLLQINKSTLPNNEVLFEVCIRFLKKGGII